MIQLVSNSLCSTGEAGSSLTYACAHEIYTDFSMHEKNKTESIIWRAGASQPSRTTGTIFLYVYILEECLAFLASGSDPTCRVSIIYTTWPKSHAYHGVPRLEKS